MEGATARPWRVDGVVRVVTLGLLVAGADLAAAVATIERRTLERPHDAVIVPTGPFTGHRTERLRLFRREGDSLVPIPYQIDPCDDEGDVDVEAAEHFVIDANDELVFLARDSGDRASDALLPAAAAAVFELEVVDPRSGAKGWTYLADFPESAPSPSPVRYVEFDLAANEARSELYSVRYAPGRSQVTGVAIAPPGRPPESELIDRMELRVNPTFSLLFTEWSPGFTEDDFRVRIDGVRNGPVRAIRRIRQSLDLGRFFPQIPNGTTYSFYYRSALVTPSKLSIPWLAVKTLTDFRFEGLSVLGADADAARYWDARTTEGLPFASTDPPRLEREGDHAWFVLDGPESAAIHMLEVPESWQEWGIQRGTIVRRDDEPAAGYSLLRMTQLERGGRFDLRSTVVFLARPYRPGDEAPAVAMIAAPLETQVHRLR